MAAVVGGVDGVINLVENAEVNEIALLATSAGQAFIQGVVTEILPAMKAAGLDEEAQWLESGTTDTLALLAALSTKVLIENSYYTLDDVVDSYETLSA